MTLPTTHQRTPATTSALREVEANLSSALAALDRRLTALETRLSAMALGASCHPEWVLHIPKQRLDTLRVDLAYLVEAERLVRMNRNPRWRTRNAT